MLTLGSLFDGIGGWLLAARRAGIQPVWSSEVDPYPMAVSRAHFPEVMQLGDIRGLDGESLPPVDIITASSPCQDLSIAGKREGLQGERSGLFRKAIEIVRGMRRATGGRFPRFFVWENVPGAFSSNKGMDFRAVLAEIGEAEVPMPPNGRWAGAGVAELPQCQIAWRVFDAQYFGVAQRRKRIFLVADFGERRAAEVLFVEKGMRWDPAAGGEAGEGSAARPAGGTSAAKPAVLKTRHPTAIGQGGAGQGQTIFVAGFKGGQSAGGLGYREGQAPTISASGSGLEPTVVAPAGAAYGICSLHSNGMQSPNPKAGFVYEARTSRTLGTNGGHPACNQGGMLVLAAEHSFGTYRLGDKSSTLRTAGGTAGGGSESLVLRRTVGSLLARDYKGIGNQDLPACDKLVIENG